MSALRDAMTAMRQAIMLAEEVKKAGEALKDVAHELREHDRRITRLEAKWETAIELSSMRKLPG